tara:strand:+ start:195 stop:584 length:390 start_codon:yes stop_codon:yes gene_type:complete
MEDSMSKNKDKRRMSDFEILEQGGVRVVLDVGEINLDQEDVNYIADMVTKLKKCDAPEQAISECVYDFIANLIFVKKLSPKERELYFNAMEHEKDLVGNITLDDVVKMTPSQRRKLSNEFDARKNKAVN